MLPNWTFHHIGIAVPELEPTRLMYISAGYEATEQIYDSLQNVYICFLSKKGMPTIELLAPHDEQSPVVNIIKKNGVTPYHLCYEVDNIEEAITELKKQHYILVRRQEKAVAMGNRNVCFLYHKQIGLIEIVEK